MLEITDPSNRAKCNFYFRYCCPRKSPALNWSLLAHFKRLTKFCHRSIFFLANICHLPGAEKRIDGARDLPWLSGRKMAQPLLKLYIMLFLWFDTENVFSKHSNCLKEEREENSKNVQLAQVKPYCLMVFPVKYLCLGVVPNRSSFPTTGMLLMSQRDHPWVWVQPILQQWMPLDKREEGVFSWEFSLWVCIQTAIRYLDAILPQLLLSWGGSAFARTVLTCAVSCRVFCTRVKSWRLWAVMGWVPAAHLQGWATSSFHGLPRLQGAVAPGESTDMFLSNLSLHLAEERM